MAVYWPFVFCFPSNNAIPIERLTSATAPTTMPTISTVLRLRDVLSLLSTFGVVVVEVVVVHSSEVKATCVSPV